MIAVIVDPTLAVAFWGLALVLLLVLVTVGAVFYVIEMAGVHDPRKGDTFSETWWWLRENHPVIFYGLMVTLVLFLLGMAAGVVLGFKWLVPHFLYGGH